MPDPSEPDPSEPRPASPTGPNRPDAAPRSAAGYVFADPAHRVAPNHHRRLLELLAETLDPFSCRRLEQAGADPDARCLEIGAGTGSIAHWLANHLAPTGQVIATDLDPSLIAPHQRITTLPHDISRDQLPGRFDLIHARLVLAHLPDRHHILGKLSEALNPGGALIIEEFDPGWDRCLLQRVGMAFQPTFPRAGPWSLPPPTAADTAPAGSRSTKSPAIAAAPRLPSTQGIPVRRHPPKGNHNRANLGDSRRRRPVAARRGLSPTGW
jgi:SAM-dependent methyltransferase